MFFKATLLILSLASISSQDCYGVAMEGGGPKGSYEAGVLFGFANATNPPYLKYNILSGVSIGAMNAGVMSQSILGDEQNMCINLINFWRSINGSSSIYVEWKGGVIDGLLFHSGIFDNSPAIELGRKWMPGPAKRNITVGSTNLDLGLFQNFDESIGYALFDGIIASASIPTTFPPHQFEGYTWVDGGVIDSLDVAAAIERCLLISQEEDVYIDLLYCANTAPLPSETALKTLDVFQRAFEIHSHDKAIWYSYNAKNAYPKVHFRYVAQPSEPMPPGFNFTREALEYGIQLGIKDANSLMQNKDSGRNTIREMYYAMKNSIIYP